MPGGLTLTGDAYVACQNLIGYSAAWPEAHSGWACCLAREYVQSHVKIQHHYEILIVYYTDSESLL
jgi:hypothetical protein|eukprot:COSAG01_NODE_10011_length_2275_cov_11.349265_2_plen_66_part_00